MSNGGIQIIGVAAAVVAATVAVVQFGVFSFGDSFEEVGCKEERGQYREDKDLPRKASLRSRDVEYNSSIYVDIEHGDYQSNTYRMTCGVENVAPLRDRLGQVDKDRWGTKSTGAAFIIHHVVAGKVEHSAHSTTEDMALKGGKSSLAESSITLGPLAANTFKCRISSASSDPYAFICGNGVCYSEKYPSVGPLHLCVYKKKSTPMQTLTDWAIDGTQRLWPLIRPYLGSRQTPPGP